MKTVDTYTATIWVGTKERDTGEVRPLTLAREYLQNYANVLRLCVSLTPTDFIYSDGGEPGFVVGLINYPRFPAESAVLRFHAIAMARALLLTYRQKRVSVVFPDYTSMVEAEDRL